MSLTFMNTPTDEAKVVMFPQPGWTKPKLLEDFPWDPELGTPHGVSGDRGIREPVDLLEQAIFVDDSITVTYSDVPHPSHPQPEGEALLKEREETHGPYAIKCEIIMAIMREIEGHRGGLDDMQNVSLDMIIHKMGRILAGDPNCKDHWDDIAGYARLISKSL
jgi:hypothetical protein